MWVAAVIGGLLWLAYGSAVAIWPLTKMGTVVSFFTVFYAVMLITLGLAVLP